MRGFINMLLDGAIAYYLRDNPEAEVIIIGMETRDKPIIIAASGKLTQKDVEKIIKLAAMTSLER